MLLRQVIYIIVSVADMLLFIVQTMMFLRALLSWIVMDNNSPALEKVMNFLYAVTEPLIYPVRVLLDKIPALRSMPIDISFMVTFLLLSMIQTMLPAVVI